MDYGMNLDSGSSMGTSGLWQPEGSANAPGELRLEMLVDDPEIV